MQVTKKSKIIIESDSEIEKQDLHHLLSLLFAHHEIPVMNPQEYGKATLSAMVLMFRHSIANGDLEIGLVQGKPYPLLSDTQQKVGVEVSGASNDMNARIASIIRKALATEGLMVMDMPVEANSNPTVLVDVCEKQITYRTDAF